MDNKIVVQILNDAYELIKDEERWTQGWYARGMHGAKVDSCSSDARKWCLAGALTKMASKFNKLYALWYVAEPFKLLTGKTLSQFNDFHNHKEVIAALQKLIKQIEQNE